MNVAWATLGFENCMEHPGEGKHAPIAVTTCGTLTGGWENSPELGAQGSQGQEEEVTELPPSPGRAALPGPNTTPPAVPTGGAEHHQPTPPGHLFVTQWRLLHWLSYTATHISVR